MTVAIPPTTYDIWGPMGTYISQLEMAVVVAAACHCARDLRNGSCLVHVDNVAALMALFKGKGTSPILDAMAFAVHFVFFTLHVAPYFEYGESASNWADEISREGHHHQWARHNQFERDACAFFPSLLLLPPAAIVRVVEYL